MFTHLNPRLLMKILESGISRLLTIRVSGLGKGRHDSRHSPPASDDADTNMLQTVSSERFAKGLAPVSHHRTNARLSLPNERRFHVQHYQHPSRRVIAARVAATGSKRHVVLAFNCTRRLRSAMTSEGHASLCLQCQSIVHLRYHTITRNNSSTEYGRDRQKSCYRPPAPLGTDPPGALRGPLRGAFK